MKYDSVLFDLDGTLWDATATLVDTWAMALSGEPDVKRPPTAKELEGVMGMTPKMLTYTLLPYLDEKRRLELFDKVGMVETKYLSQRGGILFEGIEEMLGKLSEKLKLCIVSNCNREYIPCFLTAHKLGKYFADWECIGRTGLEKWENIVLVSQRNGFKNPVYVGDTELDKISAEKAGVDFIHAAYGFGKVDAEFKIEKPLELLKLLD